jgi:predicted PurR-regulated permease PerM
MNDQSADRRPPALLTRLNRRRLFQYFFFGALLLLLWQVLTMMAPFYVAIFGAAILAILVYPAHAALLRRIPRANPAATLSTVLTLLVVVIPILLFVWLFIKQATRVYPVVQDWVVALHQAQDGQPPAKLSPKVVSLWENLRRFMDFWHIDPSEILLKNVDELGQRMTAMARGAIRNTLLVLINVLALAFTLFFFLRDGPHIHHRVIELVPMDESHKKALAERVIATLYAVIRGILVVALVQGTLAGIGYAIFGVPFPIMLGVATSILSPIPFIGTGGIAILVAIGLLLSGSFAQAAGVLLWNLLLLSSIDHILRSILISADAKLPLLLLFFGLLGGLNLYGFAGLLIGPMVIALLLVFINIYRQDYRWLLTPQEDEAGPKK